MAATATPLIAFLYLFSHMTAEEILAPLQPVEQSPTLHKRSPRTDHTFGSTAAHSFDEAVAKGYFKNENPHKPGEPLITSLEVGNCVMVPRTDGSFSYGVVTEVIKPYVVCVACGSDPRDQKNQAIKIMACANIFLDPAWLHNTHKAKDL